MDITDSGKDATQNGHTLRLGGGILWVVIQAAIYVINHFAHSYLIFAEYVTIITTTIQYNLLQRCLGLATAGVRLMTVSTALKLTHGDQFPSARRLTRHRICRSSTRRDLGSLKPALNETLHTNPYWIHSVVWGIRINVGMFVKQDDGASAVVLDRFLAT
ncbi:hypothetical protein B0H13DRAFT_2413726 [Mycena leptocephala]|nr:hypothetical protein B0H13DRAFT_2413726 [Mycena leptocephala]